MTLRYVGPYNGYIPEATGQVVAFIRQPSEFRLNSYVQYIPSEQPTGVYSILGRDESVRVVTDAEFRWEDGADMPLGELYKSRFETAEFRCIRRAYPWNIGNITNESARLFKPKVTQMAEAISMAMTNRTSQVLGLMETAANWQGNNATAGSLNGGKGFWGSSSDAPDSPYFFAIGTTLLQAARQINLYTNGVVKVKDLRLILNPSDAIKMAMSPEMKHYLGNSPAAKEERENPGGDVNMLWGLPKYYQGIEFVVEDASIVTERPNSTATSTTGQATNPGNRNYIKQSNTAMLVSRPGGLDGQYGNQNFSTLQVYYHKDLLRVKQEYDSWNEKMKGAVVDFFVPKLAAPPSGYLIQNLFQ